MSQFKEDEVALGEDSELIRSQAEKLTEQPKGKLLYIKNGQEDVDFTNILAQLIQYVNIGHVLAHVDKVKQYVVQIPLQYQKALDEGIYFINQNQKTGVMWPSLMEIKESGRWGFVDNLPIVKQELDRGNPMRDISMNFYNLTLQKQLASIADAVERTYKTVERIEHGQMDDRVALLYSGREQIQLAMTLKDSDSRKQAIALGRQRLIDAKNQIGMTLKRRIEEFEPIPKGWFVQRWHACRHKGIFDQRDDEFQEMQDYYELYLQATKLLATSYIAVDEIDAANKVYEESINFVKTIQFRNAETIKFIHKPLEIQDLFVYHPDTYIKAEQENAKEDAKKFDYMIIEATGEELLEVFRDGCKISK